MHGLRKYYATKLINAGVEEIIVISQMGHTDFKTTKNYYYKNNIESEYVVDRISKAISG
jgi:integrase